MSRRTERTFYVYIMSNRSKTLYVGVTNNLERRALEHKERLSAFTSRYNLTRLVYYETTDDPGSAIAREKQIKGWLRKRKVELIEALNPEWDDLSEAWYREEPDSSRSLSSSEAKGSE